MQCTHLRETQSQRCTELWCNYLSRFKPADPHAHYTPPPAEGVNDRLCAPVTPVLLW